MWSHIIMCSKCIFYLGDTPLKVANLVLQLLFRLLPLLHTGFNELIKWLFVMLLFIGMWSHLRSGLVWFLEFRRVRGRTLSGVTNFLIIHDCLSKCDCYVTIINYVIMTSQCAWCSSEIYKIKKTGFLTIVTLRRYSSCNIGAVTRMREDINKMKSIRAAYKGHCTQDFLKGRKTHNFKKFRSRWIGGTRGQTHTKSWRNSADEC